jgi:hypothetical protein
MCCLARATCSGLAIDGVGYGSNGVCADVDGEGVVEFEYRGMPGPLVGVVCDEEPMVAPSHESAMSPNARMARTTRDRGTRQRIRARLAPDRPFNPGGTLGSDVAEEG